MKKIVVAVVLIIVAVASIPFAGGLLLEKYVRSSLEDLNALYAQTGTGYSLEIINYDRRYLTSDVEWKIDLGTLKAMYPIEDIVFLDHARHGFAGVVSTTSLKKNPWYSSFIDQKLDGRDPLHISTECSFLGNIETTILSDPFSAVFEAQQVDVKPAHFVIATDYKLRFFDSTGEWQGMSVGENMDIGPTTLALNLVMHSTYLWDGDFSFGLQHVKVQDEEEQLDLRGMKGTYLINVDEDKSMLSGEVRLSIDGINAKEMKVDNAKVRFSAGGLSVENYEAFMEIYTQTVSKLLAEMAALESQSEKSEEMMKQQMAAIGVQMVAAYEKLMKQGLELKISDLEMTLADGDISGDLTLRLLKDMTFMQLIPIVGQPEMLLDILYLKSNFRLPAQLVGENPNLLNPAYPGMQTGIFVKDGDDLVHQAETTGGKLMLNNTEVILKQQGSL